MQTKLFTSIALIALTLPLQVLCGYGRISYYEGAPTRSNPGACGREYVGDYYIALNSDALDGHKDKYCGKCVKITYNNKYLVGLLNDRCPGCPRGGLDVAPKIMDFFVGSSNRKRIGVIQASWEIVSCDLYGKKGECSGSSCSVSGSSHSGEISNHKATTTHKKTTTVVVHHHTTTQKAQTHTHTHTEATPVAQKEEVAAPVVTKETPVATEEAPVAENFVTVDVEADVEEDNEAPVEIELQPVIADASSTPNVKPVTPAKETQKEEKADEKEGGSYILPITGVLMVSGAAGVGLLYLKRENKYGEFQEQVKNLTRSITTRGSSLRRNITRSIKNRRKNVLPTTNEVAEVSY